MKKYRIGEKVEPLVLEAVSGGEVTIPASTGYIHLQFRRFAGCPICNLHMRSIARRIAEIESAGIREVVVFHSSADAIRHSLAHLPFATVADPSRRLYKQFGVEESPRAKRHPRAWRAALLGAFATKPTLKAEGGTRQLPADLLIDADGRIVALKYGDHADDQWSVDELLHFARDSVSNRAEAAPAILGA
jgi:peroxiredoxin